MQVVYWANIHIIIFLDPLSGLSLFLDPEILVKKAAKEIEKNREIIVPSVDLAGKSKENFFKKLWQVTGYCQQTMR